MNMKSSLSLLSAVGLAMSLSVASTALAQNGGDYGNGNGNGHGNGSENCIFFDKIIFKVKYDWYDIKIRQQGLSEVTNLTQAVKDFCGQYSDSDACKWINEGEYFEIKDVDFAAACPENVKQEDYYP